jgi:hypothetical protein
MMGKSASTAVLDGALDVIATATKFVACSAQPTTYTEANSTFFLAGVVVAGGDFTKAAGTTNGRKITVAQKTGVTVTNSGTATHVALIITGSSTLLYVTTATSQALLSSNTLTMNGFSVECADPT